MIAQSIADYLGVSTGEMRELASEGALTASVVKNAIFAAADEINAKFEQMPMTWAQVWTTMKNTAIQALEPVLDAVNWAANNIDTVGPLFISAAAGVLFFAAAVGIANGALTSLFCCFRFKSDTGSCCGCYWCHCLPDCKVGPDALGGCRLRG